MLAFVLLIIGIHCNGQAYQKTDTGIKTTVKSINYEIDFYSSSIIRVKNGPKMHVFERKPFGCSKTRRNKY